MEIKERIISGKLKPDSSLIEENFASDLQISRTPLREALQRLEIEDLVVRQPNGRLKVAPISQQEVQELFTVRSLLEGLVVRSAALEATSADLEVLSNILEQIKRAAEQGDEEDILEYGSQFHSQLYKLSRNKTAVKLLGSLNDHINRYRRLVSRFETGRDGKAYMEHKKILDSLKDRDPDKAEQAMKEHILNSLHSVVDKINQYEKS
ncbi:GntR family transcriptional regulator [Paenibacillus macerans]|uniref:GntR family transcriptional regulator n=1 Tax=Paenibacillus macerans TaxID=44252 RepID=UPI002E248614|nr:GntR family transcriptional regulator [Paenibacillus macerans]